MPWEIHWPKVKRRPSSNISKPQQSNYVQFLPPVEEHPRFRQPFSHMFRKPVPSSVPSSIAPEVTRLNILNIQNTNIAPARILFQTDSYIISTMPGKNPQDALNAIRQDGIPCNDGTSYSQSSYYQHEDANRYHQRLSPVPSAHEISADDDDLVDTDIQLPPVRTSTPLGFGPYDFSGVESVNRLMLPYLQFHPDTPIGGHEAARVMNPGPNEKRYKTPKIKFSMPGEYVNGKWPKARKERHSSSSYIPPNHLTQIDGNNSRTQSQSVVSPSSAPESCSAPECITENAPGPSSTSREGRESCHALECVGNLFLSAPPAHIEKWISETNFRISSIDGANTPPVPLTSISDPPPTSIRHSQSVPTAPLPIPIETPLQDTLEEPEIPAPSKSSKFKDKLRNKRGKKARLGLRKCRKLIFRKGVLKVVLGRQLAQPTADLLDMMAQGIEFDPPDMKGFAKVLAEVPDGGLPV